MTVAELRYKAARSYMMALASNSDAAAERLYDEGDRYNDMADALIEHADNRNLELA